MKKQSKLVLVILLVALSFTLIEIFESEYEEKVEVTSDVVELFEKLALVTYVVDGDTIKVDIEGKEETVRYIGIDTPEPYSKSEPECFSKEASSANRDLVEGKQVRLVADKEDRDRYGRLLRYIYVDEVFVNAELVRDGFAKVMNIKPNSAHYEEFLKLEKAAQERSLGMWGVCK